MIRATPDLRLSQRRTSPASAPQHALGGSPPRFAPRWRYRLSRQILRALVKTYFRLRVESLERLPAGPAVLCFNHIDWADPLFFVVALPADRRIFFFGPEQEDMGRGMRNRLMQWAGVAVPFKPGRRGLVAATRRVDEIVATGATLAIAGEGTIHAREADLLPLDAGAAYFALRLGIPLVPLAINGTSWLTFRGDVRVRVGDPILATASVTGRPSQAEVEELSARAWTALHSLVSDYPEKSRPGPFGRWLTEVFNEWRDPGEARAR